MSNNQLNDLSKTYLEAVYGGGKKKEAPKDNRLVVTAADKKANTKAYQNYKAGNKAYKAADHLKDDYEFARHKASIISRGGRLEDAVESWNQKLAYREAMKNVSEKKEVNVNDTYKTVADLMHGEEKRWQDDDGDGKWYEKSDVDGKISKREKKATKHKCASKVKHEEFGIGNPVKGMHDLDESGNVAHYDVMFGHGVEKNVPVSSLEILEGSMHEHVIHTEQKKSSKEKGLDGKACWDGYKLAGTKKKGGKTVDNCVKVKKESLSDWRTDLNDLIEIVAEPEEQAEKKIKEGKVKNKVVINPKISEAIQEMGGEVLEHHQVDCDDDCEPNCEHDVAEGQVKKEIKALSTAAKTLKGKNVAKADKIEEEKKGKKNCGCGQDPCITYGEQKEGDSLGKSQVEESEKLAQKAYDRAQKLGAKRRSSSNPRGIGKSERAGYNLAQSQRSRNVSGETQGGPQTGGGPKSYGYARNKSNPVKSKSVGDTGATGHYKKRDQKVTSKSGKTTRYKLKFRDRMDHHVSKRQELKDPKKNPKHTANTQKEENFFSRFRNI